MFLILVLLLYKYTLSKGHNTINVAFLGNLCSEYGVAIIMENKYTHLYYITGKPD